MGSKKKLSNKSDKSYTPKETPKAIDWDSLPENVEIVVKGGKVYTTTKATAKLIVTANKATLK
jgi:hypothetical protein